MKMAKSGGESNKRKYTEDGLLPVVTPGTIHSFSADIVTSKKLGKPILKQLMDKILEENPGIGGVILSQYDKAETDEERHRIMWVGVTVYELFRKQLKAYEMESEFKE